MVKPTRGRRPMRCCSKQSKKPKLKDPEVLELPRNLQGWRGATAWSHHALSNKADGGQEKRKANWHVILDFPQQKQLKGCSGKMKHRIKCNGLTRESVIKHRIIAPSLFSGSPFTQNSWPENTSKKIKSVQQRPDLWTEEVTAECKTEKHSIPQSLPRMCKDRNNKVLKDCMETWLTTSYNISSSFITPRTSLPPPTQQSCQSGVLWLPLLTSLPVTLQRHHFESPDGVYLQQTAEEDRTRHSRMHRELFNLQPQWWNKPFQSLDVQS